MCEKIPCFVPTVTNEEMRSKKIAKEPTASLVTWEKTGHFSGLEIQTIPHRRIRHPASSGGHIGVMLPSTNRSLALDHLFQGWKQMETWSAVKDVAVRETFETLKEQNEKQFCPSDEMMNQKKRLMVRKVLSCGAQSSRWMKRVVSRKTDPSKKCDGCW